MRSELLLCSVYAAFAKPIPFMFCSVRSRSVPDLLGCIGVLIGLVLGWNHVFFPARIPQSGAVIRFWSLLGSENYSKLSDLMYILFGIILSIVL